MDFGYLVIFITIFLSLYFEIFLLYHLIYGFKKYQKRQEGDFFPSVSIIVPCWNEEDTVAGTIKSLLNLNYPKDKLKIIVVDDGSTDKTAKEVQRFLPHPQIKFIQKENGGKHTAMNEALKIVDTDLVGSLDADSFVEKDALKKIVIHFKNPKIASVVSSIKSIGDEKNIWVALQKSEYFTSILMRKIFSFLGSVFITPGPFSIFRTQVVKDLGGWRKAYNTEDLDIALRIQRRGLVIENEEKAIIYTKALKTFKALYKQRLRWVYGFLRNIWDNRDMVFNPRYGNLGMVILPSFIIMLILSILVYFVLLWNFTLNFIDWIKEKMIVGFHFNFSWDWFFTNTDLLTLPVIILSIFSIFIIVKARELTNEKKFSLDIPVYILLYGIVSPIWLTAALVKAVLKIEQEWEDN